MVGVSWRACGDGQPGPPAWGDGESCPGGGRSVLQGLCGPEEYEATGYRLVEDILPGDLVDQLCAVHLEGEENWEDILLHPWYTLEYPILF